MLLTDGGGDSLLAQLEANAAANADVLRKQGCERLEVEFFRFGGDTLPRDGAFDWVIGSDVTYSVHDARDALCASVSRLLERGSRCVLSHEHRRSDMFDVYAILANRPAERWDENDVALREFLTVAREHGLSVRPLVLERGARVQRGDIVYMTTDLSVFELTRAK